MNETNARGVRQRSVEIVVPVYNEAHVLADSVGRLHAHLEASFPFPFRITVADSASTDTTWRAATEPALRLPHVHAVRLDAKGRGRALNHVRSRSTADVMRGPKREFVSRSYNALLKSGLPALPHSRLGSSGGTPTSDAQGGFKAVRTDVSRSLEPHIQDNSWFFDTELLVRTALDDLRGVRRMLRAGLTGRSRVPVPHGHTPVGAPQHISSPVPSLEYA
ncbi:glycosyltransferase [Streptomyces sp. NBC_01390]|uniref:glycosyltransferase n=1 Tax=Streptomyces sp. NBC_01390 TaxID=2903850 RepID=UPI0032438F48